MGNVGQRQFVSGADMDDSSVENLPRNDLPQYTLRVSSRAKRMQLKVDHWGKVEVVVPRNVSLRHVAPFVHRHRGWLARALAQFSLQHHDASGNDTKLPSKVLLPALGEEWVIEHCQGEKSRYTIIHEATDNKRLRIETDAGASPAVPLRTWIHDYARHRLPPWLRRLSEECGLPFSGVTVRAQKTRWGSCGARGNINLNRHLLFLPPHLTRYVMIHELCHTIHLNHSKRYWSLVGLLVPDFESCEYELRRGARYVPRWACAD